SFLALIAGASFLVVPQEGVEVEVGGSDGGEDDGRFRIAHRGLERKIALADATGEGGDGQGEGSGPLGIALHPKRTFDMPLARPGIGEEEEGGAKRGEIRARQGDEEGGGAAPQIDRSLRIEAE